MKRSELIRFKKMVNAEIDRRERIKDLLENDLVREYLEITKTNPDNIDTNNISEIIRGILSTFTITETNGIYVCTRAWYEDWCICYEDTSYYSRNVEINSKYAGCKTYTDIESGKIFRAVRDGQDFYGKPMISYFEANNIVLNPYNTSKNRNGYDEVKFDFFETVLRDGQAKAKKLVLEKYPRI